MGEILSFADRNFYNDWWNSDDIVVFLENLEPSSASLGSPTSVQTFAQQAQCLKITEKVSFNIASEASYVYILSGQKLINNTKSLKIFKL